MHAPIPITRLDQARAAAGECVHFGFCTAVCPTYILDGEENDSPRGRFVLIKEMLASKAPPRRATVVHLDRCLSCLSCETSCGAGVNYRVLIDIAREYVESSRVRSLPDRLFRSGVAALLTSPRMLRGLRILGKPLSGLVCALPGRLGALGRLANAPGLAAFSPRGAPVLPAPCSREAPSPQLRSVALLEGCAQSVLGAEINCAARRVLARAGVRVVESRGNFCCGAMKLHLGFRDQAIKQAARCVRHWGEMLAAGAIDAIAVTTSGCGSVIRHYDELFADDAELGQAAASVARAARDISVILAELPLPLANTNGGALVAYHDACSMKHGQRITREPRALLRKMGYVVADIAEGHICCGSAGTYNILQPEMSARLGQRKAANIEAIAPDVIAAGNLGCLIQISRFAEYPVAHTVQLVDWASGGPAPRGLEGFVPRPLAQEASAEVPAAEANGDNSAFW